MYSEKATLKFHCCVNELFILLECYASLMTNQPRVTSRRSKISGTLFFETRKILSTFLPNAPDFRMSIAVRGASSEVLFGVLTRSWNFDK